MSRWLRRIGVVLGSLIGVVAVFVGWAYYASSQKAAKVYDVALTPFTAVSDSLSIARGKHLVESITKCVVCHGPDLGGATLVDDPALGILAGKNITSAGGVIGTYSDAELARLIRHGVKRDGHAAAIMPSEDWISMADDDLSAIIAYLRSVPPVDRPTVNVMLRPMGKVLFATGKLPLYTADIIDHTIKPVASMVPDSTVGYGRYLADIGGCTGCHGPGLSGGPIPGLPPETPPAANLTPTGISHYTDAQLEHALRAGVRPDGSKLKEPMPVASTTLMTPIEMSAVIKFLRTVAPKEFGGR
ncbi:MAG: c-type cytochrome [Gemmatimonadaceae bacterium]|nr:c-type cytochrome [Gemmatimonadaceae bacterium]